MIRFGPAGNSDSFYAQGFQASWQAPAWLRAMGLSAYEYSFGRGVQLGEEMARKIAAQAKANDIAVSAHAPYFINLANPDPEKWEASFRYITDSARLAAHLGGDRVVVHVGAPMKLNRQEALKNCREGLREAYLRLDDLGLGHIHLCPETMGRPSQIGDLAETLQFCLLDDRLIPNTLSDRVLQGLARKQLGFEGLILSDDVRMAAVEKKYGAPLAAVLAAQAGCDLVIIGSGGDNLDLDRMDVQGPIVRWMVEAAKSGELSMERIDDSVRRIIAVKLALGDMRSAAHPEKLNWTAHEAFARELALQSVRVERDRDHILPLSEGTLFLSRKESARLGVEEGDQLYDSFAALAAPLLRGECIEFEQIPDVEALRERIEEAPSVVLSVTWEGECLRLLETMKEIMAINPRFCFVCLNAPHIIRHVPFVPCVIFSYDQSIHSVQAVCARMQEKVKEEKQ